VFGSKLDVLGMCHIAKLPSSWPAPSCNGPFHVMLQCIMWEQIFESPQSSTQMMSISRSCQQTWSPPTSSVRYHSICDNIPGISAHVHLAQSPNSNYTIDTAPHRFVACPEQGLQASLNPDPVRAQWICQAFNYSSGVLALMNIASCSWTIERPDAIGYSCN